MTLIKSIEDAELQKEPRFVGTGKNLHQVGFFSVSKTRDNKKAPKEEKIVKLSRLESDSVNAHVEILVAKKIGLPTTSDLTKYLAFLDIIQDRFIFGKQPIENPIKFTNYELLSRIGLSIRGGRKNSTGDEIKEWLLRMKSTTVHFTASDEKRTGGDIVSVFDRATYFGEKLDDGSTAECNYVWLSNWELSNLMSKTLVPVDLVGYRQLKNNTAKLLVPHLQIWLYASRNNPPFNKNYEDFCSLLGLQQYSSENEIIRTLSPAMDELKKYKYIKKWLLTGSRRSGYKISIWHGDKFTRDLQLFFVVKDNQSENGRKLPQSVKPTAPRLLKKSELTGEQKQTLATLIEKEIDADDAEVIVRTLDAEEINLRLKYCAFLFAQAPDKYPSQRGYIYTILKDESFTVPNSVLEKIRLWEEKLQLVRERLDEQSSEERNAAQELWLQTRFDEFCFGEAQKGTNLTFLLFSAEYHQGREIWEKLIAEIESSLDKQIFDAWFKTCSFAGFNSETLTLQVATSDVAKLWIDSYYPKNILDALAKFNLSDYKVELIAAELPAEDEAKDFFFYRLTLIQEYKQKGILSLDEFYAQNKPKLDEEFAKFYQIHQSSDNF